MLHYLGFCWCGTAHARMGDIPDRDCKGRSDTRMDWCDKHGRYHNRRVT